jgi:hypothetical protein
MNDTSNSVKQRKTRYDLNFKCSAVEHWLGINVQTLKIWKQQIAVLSSGASAPRTVSWSAPVNSLGVSRPMTNPALAKRLSFVFMASG